MHDDFLVYEMLRMKWANSAPKWRHTASHYRSIYIGVYRTRYPILDTYTECSAMWKTCASEWASERANESEWREERKIRGPKERAQNKWTKKILHLWIKIVCATIALILLIRFLLLSHSLSLLPSSCFSHYASIALGWFYPPLVTLMHKHIL